MLSTLWSVKLLFVAFCMLQRSESLQAVGIPVSIMISRLLQSAAATFSQHGSSRAQAPLESVTEEAHTRDLLYPEPSTIYATQLNHQLFADERASVTPKDAASFDDRGGLDLISPDDVRIIVAQDANSRYQSPQVLFDTKSSMQVEQQSKDTRDDKGSYGAQASRAHPEAVTNPQKTQRSKGHQRYSSLLSGPQATPTSPSSPQPSDVRIKATSGNSRALRQASTAASDADVEAIRTRALKEEKEGLDDLLGSAFGAAGFRLEASTKLHVLSSRKTGALHAEAGTLRPVSSGGFPWKRVPPVASRGNVEASEGERQEVRHGNTLASSGKPAIMLTRLFTVNLPDSGGPDTELTGSSDRSHAVQDNALSPEFKPDSVGSTGTAARVKQKRVPMYAVAVILQLPVENPLHKAHVPESQLELTKFEHSPPEPPFMSSWRTAYNFFDLPPEAPMTPILDPALKGHISYVLAHWRTISRSMELLEVAARCKLQELLEAIPLVPPLQSAPLRNGSRKTKRPKQPMQQSVYVFPSSLQTEELGRHASYISRLITNDFKTRRVITGQSRWGAWKEEAKWVGRWAGNRDQNFFFYNVLTAFLGSHTTWLQTLGPIWYRRRCALQLQRSSHFGSCVERRTVIVASDKMAARRLLFLLAGFLPSSRGDSISHASFSPPAGDSSFETFPTESSRQAQLLKRAVPDRSHLVHKTGMQHNAHTRSVSFSVVDGANKHNPRSTFTSERRGSETRLTRTPSLAIPNQVQESKKASASLSLAGSDYPVPHFTSPSANALPRSAASTRPGSGGSLASAALSHNVKRSDSLSIDVSGSGAPWGSVVNGFWGNRRGSAAANSETLGVSPSSSPGRKPAHGGSPGLKRSKLAQMVDEVEFFDHKRGKGTDKSRRKFTSPTIGSQRKAPFMAVQTSPAKTVPNALKAERMPLKIALNEEDGCVDVSLSPGYSWKSSLASSFASLRAPSLLPPSSYENCSTPEEFFTADHLYQRSEPHVEVAGWLKTYQPCFELQAVAPYDALMEDIKSSMYAESRLSSTVDLEADLAPGKWVEVCSTLVADANSFAVERLRLFKRKQSAAADAAATGADSSNDRAAYEEKLVTEPIMDMDAILIDAVERLLMRSGSSSRTQSRAHSPKPMSQSSGRSGATDAAERPPAARQGRVASSLGPDRRTHTGEASPVDCQRILVGALQEVVRSVLEEWEGGGAAGSRDGGRRRREPDNSLREGVRKWLTEVEEGG